MFQGQIPQGKVCGDGFLDIEKKPGGGPGSGEGVIRAAVKIADPDDKDIRAENPRGPGVPIAV